jgi:small conductance mechanosensitive channel
MTHFLAVNEEIKKLMPDVNDVKETIIDKEMKLNNYFDTFITSLVEYAPKAISAIVVLFIGLWVIKRVAKIADKTMMHRDLDVSLRTFLKSLLSIGLKIILIVTVAGMIGVGTASFVTILGAAGLAVGLALQGSLSNFAGGVLILIFKPFKVGDSIEAAGQSGEVKEIQIFNTILLTGEHKTVILPNGPLSNGTIVNITRHGNIRVELEFKISNHNDLNKVKQIIQSVAEKNDKVLLDQGIDIFVGKFSSELLHVYVKPFCLAANAPALTSELYTAVKQAFEIHGIKLADIRKLI